MSGLDISVEKLIRVIDGTRAEKLKKSTYKHLRFDRVLRYLKSQTPNDLGVLRLHWTVKKGHGKEWFRIYNDSPYAGIVERGTRCQDWFSTVDIADLAGWVVRKMKVDHDKAVSIAHRIVAFWRRNGREGEWFVYNAMDETIERVAEGVEEALHKYFQRGARG